MAPHWRCTPPTTSTGEKQFKNEAGVGFCNITKCCTEVCPDHIHITDNAIIPLKERVVDDFYDPVRGLPRAISVVKRSWKVAMSSIESDVTLVHRGQG